VKGSTVLRPEKKKGARIATITPVLSSRTRKKEKATKKREKGGGELGREQ